MVNACLIFKYLRKETLVHTGKTKQQQQLSSWKFGSFIFIPDKILFLGPQDK